MLIAKANLDNAKDIFTRALEKSEPVIFSTDTIYGIGAPLSDTRANEIIFDIKGREKNKPFPVLISSLDQLKDIAIIEDAKQAHIIENVWPAAVTLILKAKSWLPALYTLNGTIAVRMPDKDWLRGVIQKFGPISATSANLSGKTYQTDFNTIFSTMNKYVIFYIYENYTQESSSAIVDISLPEFKIIRKSPIIGKIEKILG